MDKASSLLLLLGYDLIFAVLFGGAILALAQWRKAAYALLKRNFLAYFTSPIGYLFLCAFVCLTGFAAFWADDFFNSNLANLDQLNRSLPWILLIFIPAITMSIWADERRQGTDELLLTIPAADADIVLGKYLAAVAIYTVSLLFSQLCNYLVLASLGNPDAGLLVGNYLGYWLSGLAMIAIGMVASFLTSNLTIGFVLGVVLNVPLVLAGYSDVILGPQVGQVVRRWSIAEQFADFQGGVISLASIAFFVMLAAAMFYVSLVLIGRRHWSGGRDGHSMGGHFLARSVSLLVLVGAACVLLSRWDLVRADMTSEHLNSLHPDTVKMLEELAPKYPIHVDAYVSRDLPDDFVQRRIDLRNVLRGINALSHNKVTTQLHEVELFGEEAARAKTEYGIDSQEVNANVRGARTTKRIIFGLGVRSGLEHVSVPFLGKGVPVEYELIRSIVTVGQPKRKRVGVLMTDVQLFGSAGGMPGSPEENRDQPLIEELRKQYQVVKVDPNEPITERYDVLLAAQPSSLGPKPMKNFIDAVRRGQPTAIFEDPFPFMDGRVAGTTAQKRPQGGMPFMMQQPEAKGDMRPLWDLLGVKLSTSQNIRRTPQGPVADAEVVWQDYNPHEADRGEVPYMTHQWVFITPTSGADAPFNPESPIVSGLQQVLFLYPGALKDVGGVNRTYTELIRTNRVAGLLDTDALMEPDMFGNLRLKLPRDVEMQEKLGGGSQYVLAAQIQRPPAKDLDNKPEALSAAGEKDRGLNVVVVADVDVLYGAFFALRAMGTDAMSPVTRWNLDNVTLVLNIIDHLAGDDRFLEIRKRRPLHRELTTVSSLSESAKEARRKARDKATGEFDKQRDEEDKQIQDTVDRLRKRQDLDEQAKDQELAIALSDGKQRLERKKAELERKRDEQFREIDRELAGSIQGVQDRYKMWAVLLPPIPPLLIALCVFLVRRSHEGEGVAKERQV